MTSMLSPDMVDKILPALPHTVSLVQSHQALTRESVRSLLQGLGINEDWALDEIIEWANILAMVRDQSYNGQGDATSRGLEALVQRGVPQAPAHLSIAQLLSGAPKASTGPGNLPIRISQSEIDFGELLPGQQNQVSVTVSGGPGQISCAADMVRVQPLLFGPQPTSITVFLKGGADGQITSAPLVFENVAERVEIEVNARWSASAIPMQTSGSNLTNTGQQTAGQANLGQANSLNSPAGLLNPLQPATLLPHVPWLERPRAEWRLFLKLLLIATLVAVFAVSLTLMLYKQIGTSSTAQAPSVPQSSISAR